MTAAQTAGDIEIRPERRVTLKDDPRYLWERSDVQIHDYREVEPAKFEN
jgi:hypothetical protein